MTQQKFKIEIVYATPEQQVLISLEVPSGITIGGAIELAIQCKKFPNIYLGHHKVGIFSKIKSLETELNDGDRVEIYRSLTVDPKEARRQRVKNKKA